MAQQTSGTGDIELEHVQAAAKYALAAYVGGLVVTITLLGLVVDGFDWDLVGIGGTFYGAHNVSVGNSMLSINFLQALTSQHSVLKVLWLVPPAALALAGRAFAETRAGRSFGSDEMDGAKAGAMVAGGYAVLAVVGTFVFSEGGTSPELVDSILFMGLVYPVVFGGLGGYLSR